jgi:sodium transport system permease protein
MEGSREIIESGESPMAPQSRPLWLRIGRIGRLIRKELSEILRDRRTMLTLILMPVLVYPLLVIAFQQHFLASALAVRKSPIYRVGYRKAEDFERFLRQLQLGNEQVARIEPSSAQDAPTLDSRLSEDLEKDIKEAVIDLGVRKVKDYRVIQDRVADFELLYRKDTAGIDDLLEFLERRLAAANGRYLESRLGVHGRAAVDYMRSIRLVVPTKAPQRVSLAALIPLILILMTITGAVYPAIDLTAGERERGTLEILVAAPVPRLGLLFAKYLCVFTMAVLTALINFLTMLVTLLVSGLGAQLFSEGEFSLLVIFELLALLLLFAAFFSAVLLTLTSFARSFKEAQAYLIPLMLLSLAPGVMGMIPGLRLEGATLVTPLLNIVLLGRDLFDGKADVAAAFLVVTSTLMYALAAIAVAARIFGAEGVLYNEQVGWSDMLRRSPEVRSRPSVASALLCLAVMFPAWFLLRSLSTHIERMFSGSPDQYRDIRDFFNRIDPMSYVRNLVGIAVSSAVLFAGIPVVSAFWSRVRPRTGFRLATPSVLGLFGAACLGLSLWPLVLQVLALIQGEAPDRPEYEILTRSFKEARTRFPLLMAAALMVAGAVEELFFRGYLFSALRQRTGPAATVVASALLFGFFHLLTTTMIPSTILGLALGWVALQTGSVLPSMLMHAVHNAMLVMVGGGDLAGREDIPWYWLVSGVAGTCLGILCLWRGRKVEAES